MIIKTTEVIKATKKAIEEVKPTHVWCCYSGGNDSISFTHLIMNAGLADGVVHFNTGIGIPETREHVRSECAKYGWNYMEQETSESYEDMVTKYGFPGPPQHGRFRRMLKGRALRLWKKRIKNHRLEKVLLLVGVRADESVKRTKATDRLYQEERCWWFKPIMDWSKQDTLEYMKQHGIKQNPVSLLMGYSGECLCGAYAHKNELEMLRTFYPNTAKRIDDLTEKVQAAGFPWGWDESRPKWFNEWVKGQQFLPGIGTTEQPPKEVKPSMAKFIKKLAHVRIVLLAEQIAEQRKAEQLELFGAEDPLCSNCSRKHHHSPGVLR